MALTVLSDDDIKNLFENLTADELDDFRLELKTALHDYSNGTQSGESEVHQPHRTTIQSATTGQKTLFMPSSSSTGLGIKVVTVPPPVPSATPEDSNDTTTTTRARITGAITLFSETGNPIGILHASTLTAFRTALASSCLLLRRNRVHTLTVFGAGEQAYWHIRLALMMRGSTIRHINIINRRFSGACKSVVSRFYKIDPAIKEREGWGSAEFEILTPGYGEFDRLVKEQVRAADVIFCCTPSLTPLFDHTILTNTEGRKKGRLIVAIGSYTPEMNELPVELLHQAVKPHESGHRHYHKHATEGGVVVVDTLDGALREAGEIIDAGLLPNQLVELGELVMLKRIKMEEEAMNSSSDAASTFTSDSGNSSNSNSNSAAPSAEFDKLDIRSNPSTSMSSVFSSSFSSDNNNNNNNNSNSGNGGHHQGGSSNSRTSSPSSSSFKKGIFHSSSRRRRSSSHSAGSDGKKRKQEDHMARWLMGGNVIYKSVGLGIMDLAVGMHLVRFAREKGVGYHIEGF